MFVLVPFFAAVTTERKRHRESWRLTIERKRSWSRFGMKLLFHFGFPAGISFFQYLYTVGVELGKTLMLELFQMMSYCCNASCFIVRCAD